MTDKRFNLKLFSDSSAGAESGAGVPDGDAAGALVSAAESDVGGENTAGMPIEPAPTVPDGADENASVHDTEKDVTQRLCEALCIELTDADGLIELINAHRKRCELSEILSEASAAREYEKLSSEAVAFAEKHEGFDLQHELDDRRFGALLHSGFSVEQAYRAIHFDELVQKAVDDAKISEREALAQKLRLASDRPDENGAGGSSPAKTETDVRSLTGKGIRDILRRVEKGAKVKF